MKVCAHIDYSRGIYGFFEAHRFLSNFFPLVVPVRLLGHDYFHAENAYQAAKSLDTEVHRDFAGLGDPEQCKILGETLVVREDWPTMKDFVMFEILRQKFSKNPNLLQALLDTGNSYLEESNWWGDNYWGCCIGNKDDVLSNTRSAPSILGKNKLGHALMSLREMFRHNHIPGKDIVSIVIAKAEELAEDDEELVLKCIAIMKQERKASTSLFQSRLRIGYTRAARVVDILEQRGYVAAGDGAKPREILVDMDDLI